MKPKRRRGSARARKSNTQVQMHTAVFSVEMLSVLQSSFQAMEAVFKRQTSSHPRLPFAFETLQRVRQKVVAMLHTPGEAVQLDANEVLIMRTCVQIYLIDLVCMQATPGRNYLIALCQQIAEILPKDPPPPLRLHD